MMCLNFSLIQSIDLNTTWKKLFNNSSFHSPVDFNLASCV